jgi:D-beta-D-heptose 7-phosphate kinase/D-beta-D-heptose 1-phosphate adenosyltransferase
MEAIELAEGTGLPVRTEEEVAFAARKLQAAHGFGAVMVLRGGEVLTLVAGPGAAPLHIPCDAVEVVDLAGAMDALVATAAAGLSAGLALPLLARIGALAAGIVAGKAGIAVVREEELLEVLQPGRLAARKLCTRPQAAERVERWRRAGCRVGLLVAGPAATPEAHAALLAQARTWCERLVVALPDAAGIDGPAADRLATWPTIDLVTRYAGDTPLELIRQLRPDVLVQDPEQAPETVAGGELVQEWGGQVRRPVLAVARAPDVAGAIA